MDNNNNNTTSEMPICIRSEAAVRATIVLHQMFLNGATPVVFFIGLPFYTFILTVLIKETRKEFSYIYQALLLGGKALEMISTELLVISFYGAGLGSDGLIWYKKTYFLMFYSAHLSITVYQFGSILSLYLTASMSVDRLWALVKPMAYKLQNRRCVACAALLFSVMVAGLASVYCAWHYMVVSTDNDRGSYQVTLNTDFGFGQIEKLMILIAMCLRLVGVVTLLISNLLLVYYFRVRFVKASPVSLAAANEKEQKRRGKERSLFLMTFWQSAFCLLASTEQLITSGLIVFYAYYDCFGDLVVAIDLMLVQIFSLLEAVVPFAFNQHLRTVARRMLPSVRFTISIATPSRTA